MVVKVKLRKQGGSLAVTLPKEVAAELGVRAGEAVHLVRTAAGEFRLTAYDPTFERVMRVYERGARRYRNALRKLAE